MTMERTDVQTALAQALAEFWEGYTGVRPVKARIVLGDQAVAVLLSGVLSPAEQQFASTKASRDILGEFGQWILEQAKPQLLRLVEESVHTDSTLITSILTWSKATWLGFSRLSEGVGMTAQCRFLATKRQLSGLAERKTI